MGKISLLHGDCLDLLKTIPDSSVDMVLTDPPFGMNFQSNYRKVKYDHILGDSTLDWLEDWSKEFFRVAKNNSAHYVFCSFHNIDLFKQSLEKFFCLKNILIWEKNNTGMGDLRGNFASKCEFILFLHKGRKLINGTRDCNILKFARTNNQYHPTEKPVKLLEYLLSKFSDENDTVLDTFMGSGSTGIACINTNRNFIGIEKDENYFNISKKRINS